MTAPLNERRAGPGRPPASARTSSNHKKKRQGQDIPTPRPLDGLPGVVRKADVAINPLVAMHRLEWDELCFKRDVGTRERVVEWSASQGRVERDGEREVRLEAAAWSDFLGMLGALELVGRTVWLECSDLYVRDTLRRWWQAMGAARLRELGDQCEQDCAE
jgi:hypothetical protein